MHRKLLVIDAHDHMLGKLASRVAKELLSGQKVVVVRCEDIMMSGKLQARRAKYQRFLNKASNTNPRIHSHRHYRSPRMIFWRTVRGMLPHKTQRGLRAFKSLYCVEGIPPALRKQPRFMNPDLKHQSALKSRTKRSRLGDLSTLVGWKYDGLVQQLEDKRKCEAAEAFEKRTAFLGKLHDAKKEAITKVLSPEERELVQNSGVFHFVEA